MAALMNSVAAERRKKQMDRKKHISLSAEAISVAFILPSEKSEGEKEGPTD